MKICGYKFTDTICMKEVPNIKCVYALIVDGDVYYIGATSRLYNRVCEHKSRRFAGMDFSVSYFECDDPFEIEAKIIAKLNPEANTAGRSDCGEVKKAVTIVLKPSIKKMAEKLAKKHSVSLSELMASCLLVANNESDLVNESIAKGESTKLEAEIKFREFWGL